jgi:SOS-response transcriptional repressor LexA
MGKWEKELSSKQKNILDYIKRFIEINNYSPTNREIAKEFSISVKRGYDQIKNLERKGYIKYTHGKARTICIL